MNQNINGIVKSDRIEGEAMQQTILDKKQFKSHYVKVTSNNLEHISRIDPGVGIPNVLIRFSCASRSTTENSTYSPVEPTKNGHPLMSLLTNLPDALQGKVKGYRSKSRRRCRLLCGLLET